MKKYKINKGFIIQKIEDRVTIFDGEKSILYTFNGTASFIFQKLKLGWGKGKIIEKLIEKYKIKKNKSVKDVENCIDDLISKKLISSKIAYLPKKSK